jgi:hypothetical protein
MSHFFARLFDLAVLVLDRTGAGARLAASPFFPGAMVLDARLAWSLAFAGSAVLLLYAALAAGPDRGVRAFRVVALLAACLLPLLAARLVPAGLARPFGGSVLAGTFAAGLVHRALARRRRDGAAARVIEGTRWTLEMAGLAVAAVAALLYFREGRLSTPTTFWALFLLRLSIADLLDPSRLTRETGLAKSATKDLRAAGRGRRPVRRALQGALKLLLVVLWIALPLLAAIAPGEVARGEWQRRALLLALYPLLALGVTGLLLLRDAVRLLTRDPLDAARGAIVGAGTLLWLWLCLREPSIEASMRILPGLYAAETLAGFLFGAAARGRR